MKCPKCGGTFEPYSGWLGYESMQCGNCHFDIKEIKPKRKPLFDKSKFKWIK